MQAARQNEQSEVHPIWADALLAAKIASILDPGISGLEIKAGAGAVRDAWLSYFKSCSRSSFKRMPPDISEQQLLGGLDISATLASGRPVESVGLLSSQATLVMPMAERCSSSHAAMIGRALDEGDGISIIALNEAETDEPGIPAPLSDRLDIQISLDGLSYRQAILPTDENELPTPAAVNAILISEEMLETLALAALKSGLSSLRKTISLVRVAKCVAALNEKSDIDFEAAATAIRLVCARIINETVDEEERAPEPPPPPHEKPQNDNTPPQDETDEQAFDPNQLLNMMIEAIKAERPDLASFNKPMIEKTSRTASSGKSGALQKKSRRGKPIGHGAKLPYPDARPDILATLRTAVPWQNLRRKAHGMNNWQLGDRLQIRPSDFRYKRLKQHTESVALFVVDASGSAALERLAEAKGAIELLLADCYVRRDSVAMIAFRGEKSELILEPTRSLVRAKRALSNLPAGGPTPLASAIQQGNELALRAKRSGQSPLLIFLTDGKGNVGLDGEPGREAAMRDAHQMAKKTSALGIQSVLIDIARRPRSTGQELASQMGADYCLLPIADAGAVSKVVTQYLNEE